MKKYISIRNRKNSRGVAVIFTLGILGLLTVMALGFASTALLNRKIADNTSSADYARHIAKNIAFARVKNAVMQNAVLNSCYSTRLASYTDANGKTSQDFLHKMDTVLDGVELYRVTDNASNPSFLPNTASWQYVTDPDGKILGRYAYAVVPVSGHLDPVGNRGQTSVSGRYGFSEKEIGVYALCNGDTGLNKNADDAGVAGIKFRTFKEFAAAFSNLSNDNKKNLVKDGYRIQLGSSPEAFWIDSDQDGKKTKDELFLRFNMPTTDSAWKAMTVDQLIGKDAGIADANIKYTGTNNSISFIPWLKYWEYEHDVSGSAPDQKGWTKDAMKKQIAANIIQYNLAESEDTVSDVTPNTWATAATEPTYAGIGRHPMLNELGFAVQIRSHVDELPERIGEDQYYTYTLTYYLSIDSGVELIYPFGPTSSLSDSVVDITGHVELDLVGFIKQDEGASSSETDMSNIVKQYKLKTNISTLIAEGEDAANVSVDWPAAAEGETFFKMTLPGDPSSSCWQNNPAQPSYTSGWKFWKNSQTGTWASGAKEITFTFKIQSATSRKTDIENQIRVRSVKFCPERVILTYGGKQRDYAKLDELTVFSGDQDVSGYQYTYFSSGYEAKDPLVNHLASDWTPLSTPYIEKADWFDFQNKYPGTILPDESHRNHPVPAKLLDEDNILETATDPAFTSTNRLSSSYIRHAPMKSFWELGFISRAEAFKTLNLGRTRVFAQDATYTQRGGGTFSQGDANILDQIKFSDTDDQKDVQGKIDLNARYHKVFEWVFNKDAATDGGGTAVNWFQNLITGTAIDPFSPTLAIDGSAEGSRVVCNSADCFDHQHSDSCTSTCLAHLLMERSLILPFRNRSDLLLDPDADSSTNNFADIPGYSDLDSTAQNKLKALQRKLRSFLLNPFNSTSDDAKSKLVREQYAARFMNLFKADGNDEHIYIIVLAQSIKDIGGSPAFVDWNGDGEFDPGNDGVTISAATNFLKTGYVRKKLYTTGYERIGTVEKVKETITATTVGNYDYGADKITGETKLIVEMAKDVNTRKWRIAGYRYVD